MSPQTIYNWRRQDAVARGEAAGLFSLEQAELAVTRRANELLKARVVSPKRRFKAISVIAPEDLSVQTTARVLEVSESGFYA